MRRYIRCELSRQIYSMGLMLWSGGRTLTNFSRYRLCQCILCQFNSRPVRLLRESTTGSYLILFGSAKSPGSLRIRCFRLRFTLCCCTCFWLALEVCRFNSVHRDRFHLAFYQDFHDSAVPNDDLIRSVVRGSQGRCYCDSLQKYMRACFEFLILENVFLMCVARWAQTETRHGYP